MRFVGRRPWRGVALMFVGGLALAGCESGRFGGRGPVVAAVRPLSASRADGVGRAVRIGHLRAAPAACGDACSRRQSGCRRPGAAGWPAPGSRPWAVPPRRRPPPRRAARPSLGVDGTRRHRLGLPRQPDEHALARPLPRQCRKLHQQGPGPHHGLGFPGGRGLSLSAGRGGGGQAEILRGELVRSPGQVRRAPDAHAILNGAARLGRTPAKPQGATGALPVCASRRRQLSAGP